MGNLMRVKEKEEAVKYFEMAIHAEPPLPIAKILLARTYAYSESERRGLQKLRLLSDIKEHPLPPVTIFDDFILFHLKQVEKYIAKEAEIY